MRPTFLLVDAPPAWLKWVYSDAVMGDAKVPGNADVIGDASVSPEGGRGGIWSLVMKDGSTRHIEGVDLTSALQDAQLADVPCWHVKRIVRIL